MPDYFCKLDKEFKCPNRVEDMCVSTDTKCGFREEIIVEVETKEETKKPYVRERRWYEDFYK